MTTKGAVSSANRDVIIATLAGQPKARRIAVNNFLSSIDMTMPIAFHLMNLEDDAQSYQWNPETVNAIKRGLFILFREDF